MYSCPALLGASFNEKGDTIKEVKRRIAIAKRASGDLHRIWRNSLSLFSALVDTTLDDS